MTKMEIEKSISKSLEYLPSEGIIGSRQVGKTTLVKEITKDHENSIYWDLELPSDYARLEDPEFFFGSIEADFVIIDEMQRLPILFPFLSGLIDKEKKSKKYILLGSASPTLIRTLSESLV